jgi:hypothetical protein
MFVQLQTPVDVEADTFFDAATGRWNFGGLSTHSPTSQQDPKLTENTRGRLALMQLPRDASGYLTGHILKPTVPETCPCGVSVHRNFFFFSFFFFFFFFAKQSNK